ncbi:probable prolyl 4-hydroxylase 9 [Olea europaea subsp. europaea]|uniref:procollagen-proline 4-dioxygenase n=1 Tax=Olea europaea subsp. europaea TaxID=158383 RepID=A0A8S0SUJ4_OLEEU|nr:probable prolyl 4-hydroxylase 9 [Olea europaea subsp. europaea]
MKFKGNRVVGMKRKTRLPIVFFLCFCFFLVLLFLYIIFSQDLNRNRSQRKFFQKFPEEEGDSLGHGETGDSSISSIPFQVLSWRPRILYFRNFASAEQCQSIIGMAKSKLKPSSLALRKGETVESTKGIRTSSGAFISASDDSTGVLDFVERKIARATMIPRSHGEAFNVLRYEIGQRYVAHYDAFNPAEYGPQSSQRIASFLLYLSDVEEGGETMFPYENGANMGVGYDYERCIGFKVRPRQGDGLLFYSLYPNGTIDKTSLHGSCPVIKGEKWVATKWIDNQELEK